MRTVGITYTLTEMSEGYLARSVANPVATAHGMTKDEAGDNLVEAIRTYARLFPDRADSVLQPTPKKELVLDDPDAPC